MLKQYYEENPAMPDEITKVHRSQEQTEAEDEWVEDEDGNFVKRGEDD